MADDWRPSQYKPRGGWRAMLPDGRVVLVALVGAAGIAGHMIVHDGRDRDVSFTLMKIVAAIVAMAFVAPHLFSGKPPPKPGQFPTERSDERNRAVDDRTP